MSALYVAWALPLLLVLILLVHALAVVAVLPMTLALDTSASKDALTISLVLLTVGAIDRVIDEGRAATGPETLLITTALLFPAMARPPYAVLSGLLLLTAPGKSLRGWIAGAVIIVCTALWWTYAAAVSMVGVPPGDTSAQIAFSLANPMRAIGVFWQTLANQWSEIGQELIGVLGWLDTRLPHYFLLMATTVLVLSLLSTTSGPARRPWLTMVIVIIGTVTVYIAIYFTFTPPGAPVVTTLQGRLFLPFIAVLSLALPRLQWLGTRILPLAAASVLFLALIGPAVVVQTLVIRYYLNAG
jgi:uncharacterized membrane protein